MLSILFRWSAIATHLPKRTDNEIKNYWNTHLKKRLTKMGIDPITHKSRTAISTNLSHMTQWENARLEAEARLVRRSRVVSNVYQRIQCGSSLINKSSLSLPQPLCLDVLKAWQGITLCKLSNISELETTCNDQTIPIVNHEPTTLNTLESQNDKGTHEGSGMVYQDNYLMEAFTKNLVNDANNESYHGDFEDDHNYWSNILDKLGNNTSLSSIF